MNSQTTLNTLLKGLCLLCYGLAIASLLGLLPPDSFTRTPYVAGALLLVHAIEAFVMSGKLRLYQGAFAVSVLLTLLFGFLHWKPLADRQKSRRAD